MADLYGVAIGGGLTGNIDANARKLLGDGASGVAAGVGHALRALHRFALTGAELGKAVDPARRHAVRGGGVDDARPMTRQGVDHGHRFTGRIVVQTQHHQIHLGHQGALGFGIFAFRRINAHHVHGGQQGQTLANLQTSGAGFAVDEYFGHGLRGNVRRGPHEQGVSQRKVWCCAA